MVDVKLEASKIVRAIMKLQGKQLIYNNLYPNGTRTVKCYGGVGDKRIEQVIRAALNLITSKFEIKRTPARQYGSPGFIVKFK